MTSRPLRSSAVSVLRAVAELCLACLQAPWLGDDTLRPSWRRDSSEENLRQQLLELRNCRFGLELERLYERDFR